VQKLWQRRAYEETTGCDWILKLFTGSRHYNAQDYSPVMHFSAQTLGPCKRGKAKSFIAVVTKSVNVLHDVKPD
jgi:hypothetical protein